jgi:hypothetical protein
MEQDYEGIGIALMVIGELMLRPNYNLVDNYAPWMDQQTTGAQES